MNEKPYIIVVDDMPYNLEVIELCLVNIDADIDYVESGIKALELIQRRVPALVLLDIMMPEIDGIEVCKRIKSNTETKDITVIFLSALDAVGDKVRAFEAGGVDYITKPFDVLEVVARVQTQLNLHNMYEDMNNLIKKSFHEIYTPLGMIKGSLTLQEMEHGETEHTQNIKSAVNTLHSIYEDLYYAIKKEIKTYPPEWNELEDTLKNRLKLFQPQMKAKKITFEILSQVDSPMIHISLTELERLLDNILSNAIKYALENTIITILIKPDGDKIGIYFKNMSKQIKNVKEVFKELYQDDNNSKGLGIGLSIVKSICDKYKIDIDVDSTSESTVFKLHYKENS